MAPPRGHVFSTVFLLSVPLWAGCAGYQTPDTLERAKLGPNHCAKACYDIGMRMTALVLIESSATGCVCEPVQNATQPGVPAPSAPTAPPPAPTVVPPAAPGSPPAPPAAPPPPPHASRAALGVAAGYVALRAQSPTPNGLVGDHSPTVIPRH